MGKSSLDIIQENNFTERQLDRIRRESAQREENARRREQARLREIDRLRQLGIEPPASLLTPQATN